MTEPRRIEPDWPALGPEMADVLAYLLRTRNIKCSHQHPGPDEFCANCRARAVLAKIGGKTG